MFGSSIIKYPGQGLDSRTHLVYRPFLPSGLRSEREILFRTDLCKWPNALEAKEPYLRERWFLGTKKEKQLAAKDFKGHLLLQENKAHSVVDF